MPRPRGPPASSRTGTRGRSRGPSGGRTGTGGQCRHCCTKPLPVAVSRSNGYASAELRRLALERLRAPGRAGGRVAPGRGHVGAQRRRVRPWLSRSAGHFIARRTRRAGPRAAVAPRSERARRCRAARRDRHVEHLRAVAPLTTFARSRIVAEHAVGVPARSRAGSALRRGSGSRINPPRCGGARARSAARRSCRRTCRRARACAPRPSQRVEVRDGVGRREEAPLIADRRGAVAHRRRRRRREIRGAHRALQRRALERLGARAALVDRHERSRAASGPNSRAPINGSRLPGAAAEHHHHRAVARPGATRSSAGAWRGGASEPPHPATSEHDGDGAQPHRPRNGCARRNASRCPRPYAAT